MCKKTCQKACDQYASTAYLIRKLSNIKNPTPEESAALKSLRKIKNLVCSAIGIWILALLITLSFEPKMGEMLIIGETLLLMLVISIISHAAHSGFGFAWYDYYKKNKEVDKP